MLVADLLCDCNLSRIPFGTVNSSCGRQRQGGVSHSQDAKPMLLVVGHGLARSPRVCSTVAIAMP